MSLKKKKKFSKHKLVDCLQKNMNLSNSIRYTPIKKKYCKAEDKNLAFYIPSQYILFKCEKSP